MAQKRVLGTVLQESGRMTSEDVERALDYQRTHGGYFGEAVVRLGILKREEIDWALASQLDLPFIFPDADAADREVARLVTAEWALAHLAVPIVRTGDTVKVVVADPLDGETLDDLRARTGLDMEMALASASRIRELIRSVYGAAARPEDVPAVTLDDLVTEALAAGADRIGVSVRGMRALGWYTVRDRKTRRTLEPGWADALESLVEPSPLAAARDAEGAVVSLEGRLRHGGAAVSVDLQVMTSLSGSELLIRPHREPVAAETGGLPDTVVEELRLLAAGGSARVGVRDAPGDVLPRLPSLVMGDNVRAAHVTRAADLPGVFTLRVEAGDDRFADALESYDFDVITTDLDVDDDRLPPILDAVPLSFLAVPTDTDPAALDGPGINWILSHAGEQDGPGWELRPMHR
ncbi:MAG TPA: hypothetical protein VK966_01225 [Longimicrobiales bacterium]|nr:hypothetical protein [Longimicrobiales bacterium]